MLNKAWPAFPEIALEDVARFRSYSAFNEIAREVCAAYEVWIRCMARRAGKASLDPDAREVRCHAFGPRATSASYRCQTFLQHQAVGVDLQADDVNGLAVPRDGDLDAGDEVYAMHERRRACFGNATRHVMVGERKNSDAVVSGFSYQGSRVQQPIGRLGMGVKIDRVHARRFATERGSRKNSKSALP